MASVGGRPTDYTPELANHICEVIASTPKSLRDICDEDEKFPDESQLYRWMFRYPGFRGQYLEAKELQATAFAEKVVRDAYSCPEVTESINKANHVFRVMQWHLSKLAPKQFGDKKEVKQEMNINVHEQDLAHLK